MSELLCVILGTSEWQLESYGKRCILNMYSLPLTISETHLTYGY